MTPENWSLIGTLYRAALERGPAERASFLENACGGNESLRLEVDSLLVAEHEAGDFLQAGVANNFAEPSASKSPSREGQKLRQYELLSRLGTGGMGEVYCALDTKLQRMAAIKILPLEFAGDPERLRRFEQEAQAASSLNHPNIVTIYETGEAEYGPFLAMEFVQGETLRRSIDARLPLDDVARICRQAAQALKMAHAVGIVHRDIKPENLMLRPDGYVKVLDFGLARLLRPIEDAGIARGGEGELPSAITEPGMVVGTFRYMSPEQVQRNQVTGASDIFSLGLVMYELATGRHPFRAETEFGTLDAILCHVPLAPSRVAPGVPAVLEQLILRMLDKRAEARPSAAEVEQTLAGIAARGQPERGQAEFQRSRRSVGRRREHEKLNSLWDCADGGAGVLCCVSGEPGIGKTTLVEDFLSGLALSGRFCLVARGRCSERLAGTEAYSPFLEALETMQRGAPTIADTMKRVAPTWHSQVASDVTSGSVPGRPRVERAYSQERMKRELGSFLQELSQRRTIVLFLEDLHWADLSTVDLLAFIADRMADSRLLILITYRASELRVASHPLLKSKQEMQVRGIAREIKLDFLSREEVGEYIGLEFPQHRLPPAVAEMIHAKTEGSPLFMTGLLRYFKDRQIIANKSGRWELARPLPDIEHDMPESMRAMIEKMIGQLDKQDRLLLVAASVQGPEFDSAVVAHALSIGSASVEERLQALERVYQFAGLIEERELPEKAITLRYRFTHVLYQNALYATIQPARRVVLSNAVADALLALHGRQSSAIASDLARLFEAGRRFLQAAEHYLCAAENTSRIFAASEAAALARQGLAVIQSAPETHQRNEIEFSLQLVLGNALLVVLGYGAPEVEELYERAHGLCSRVGQPAQLLPILYGLWISNLIHGKIERALEFGRHFLDLAEQVRSPAVLVGERMVGVSLFYLGQLKQARPHFERAVSSYDPAQHRALAWLYGQEPGMTAHSYLAWTLWLLGYPDQAAEHNRKSLQLARQVEHALSRGHGLFFAAIHAHLCRDWAAFGELADDLVSFGRERGLTFWLQAGRVLSGLMRLKDGRDAGALAEMCSGIETLIVAKNRLCLTILYRVLAEGYEHLGMTNEALSVIQAARELIEGTRERFFEPELHRFRGEALLQQNAPNAESEAEECFTRALEMARQQSTKSWELRIGTSLSRLWIRQGKQTKAFDLLMPLSEWFTEGRNTADVTEAHVLLEELR